MTKVARWKQRVETEIPRVRQAIENAVAWLARNPEPGGAEHLTAAFLCEQFDHLGFTVKEGAGGLPTAFIASSASATPGANVGLVVVYDAVPAVDELGVQKPNHSCGHLVVAAGVIATAMIWQVIRSESKGILTVVGCPADEHATDLSRTAGGGKAALESAGAFGGLDAVIYAHPEDRNAVWRRTQWMARVRAKLVGERSVDSGIPALLARVAEVGADIERSDNGTTIAIEHIETWGDSARGARIGVDVDLIVRSDSEDELERALHKAIDEENWIAWEELARYVSIKPHEGLIASVESVFGELGLEFDESPPLVRYATDFGRVSASRPSALIALGSREWAFHSDRGSSEFLQAAVPEALEFARVISVLVPVLTEAVDEWPSH